MSGHEKFYIPHDDLLELKTAIESLETEIETLDTSVNTLDTNLKTLNARLSLPGEELNQWFTSGEITGDDSIMLLAEALHATSDCYLRRVIIHGLAESEPFLARGEGLVLRVYLAGGGIWHKTLSSGNMIPVGSGSSWQVANTWNLNGFKVTAGVSLMVELQTFAIPTFTYIMVNLAYSKALAE